MRSFQVLILLSTWVLNHTGCSRKEDIAVDAESAIIGYLTDHKTQLGPAKIVPKKVGFQDPELAPESVDAVVTLDTWHHVAGQEAYAQKVHDGLRQCGRFVVVDYAMDAETGPPIEMRLSPDDVIVQLKNVGFRAEVVSETMPHHYMVVGIKDKKLE